MTFEDEGKDEMEVWANEMREEGGYLVTSAAELELAAFDDNVSIYNTQRIASAMNDEAHATVRSNTPVTTIHSRHYSRC
jgi:hypothetical protein